MQRFRTPAKLRWSDLAWTVLPALLWFLAIYSRGSLINPHCAQKPDQCTAASLLAMDRPAVGLEAPGADAISFTTQGLSGVVAIAAVPTWQAALAMAGRITPAAALIATGIDLTVLLQTTFWNGLLTESAHLATQRGRPFVYVDPARARDYSNYTSFYSGHTSFAAASTVALFLILLSRGAPTWLLGLAGTFSYSMISLTGLFRVLAGRHFPTDVLIGALAGICVALAVAYRVRRH
jgi:membrane-associated phospholipid phosphatase